MDPDRSFSATPRPGFLGFTSSVVDYDEVQTPRGTYDVDDDRTATQASQDAAELPLDLDDEVDRGADILLRLLRFPYSWEALIMEWYEVVSGYTLLSLWVEPMCKSVKADICGPLRNHDQSDVRNDNLHHEISRRLFRNTLNPLTMPGDCTFADFPFLFTGRNLRWEVIGLIFASIAAAMMTRSANSPALALIGGLDARRRTIEARRLVQVAETCLFFCQKTGNNTDLEMLLCFSSAHIRSVIDGDASLFSIFSLSNNY